MNTLKTISVLGLTFIFCVWAAAVANQHDYYFLLMCFFVALGILYFLLRTILRKKSWFFFGGAGAVSGYLAFVAAAAATQCAERGFSCVARDITGNLYYAPLMSLGWVYGAVVFALIKSLLPEPRS